MKKTELIFRKSMESDIDDIFSIVEMSKASLKSQGVDQWQDGYPGVEDIEDDVKSGFSRVVVFNGAIIASFALMQGNETAYKDIFDGEWLTESEDYGVLHRLCVKEDKKCLGVGEAVVDYCTETLKRLGAPSLRVDTHEDNKPMRALIKKCNFKYCGIVLMRGDPRLAYELVL